MHRLYLLRHAKSSWDDAARADHDRPLAPRGRRAAKVIARHLRDAGIAPALVLCSSSARTCETLERIAPALGAAARVEVESELYAAPARRLLDRLRAVPEDVESVMLIGHNPGIEDLALDLAAGGSRLPALRQKFPTGALATLAFSCRWRELGPRRAELTDFVTPKGLAKR